MTHTLQSLALLLALAGPLAAAPEDDGASPYRSETYGRPSGDQVDYDLHADTGNKVLDGAVDGLGKLEGKLPDDGLLLELVSGRLRLFGGFPGDHAAILVADRSDERQVGNATLLVDSNMTVYSGSFDAKGYFEVPVAEVPADSFYAQGLHHGGSVYTRRPSRSSSTRTACASSATRRTRACRSRWTTPPSCPRHPSWTPRRRSSPIPRRARGQAGNGEGSVLAGAGEIPPQAVEPTLPGGGLGGAQPPVEPGLPTEPPSVPALP